MLLIAIGTLGPTAGRPFPVDGYRSESKQYSKIEPGFQSIPNDIPAEAKTVYIWNGYLVHLITDGFKNLADCTMLSLSNDYMREIDEGAWNGLVSLEILILSYNQLVKLRPNIFSDLRTLTELNLQNNFISEVEDRAFFGLRNLHKLNLSNNRLTEISPEMFGELTNLKQLSVERNLLVELKFNNFLGLESLEGLFLGSNRIKTIEGEAFGNLYNLNTLDLSNNTLKDLHSGMFLYLISLIYLGLDGNELSSIEEDDFLLLPRPLTLNLSNPHLPLTNMADNPWQCSNLCWLKAEEDLGLIRWGLDSSSGSTYLFKPQCTEGYWSEMSCHSDGHVTWGGKSTDREVA